MRTDSEATRDEAIQRIVSRVRFSYESTYTEEETIRVVEETHDRTESYVERQVTRQVKAVLGVDPLPTMQRRRHAFEFVRENVALIRSVESEFFGRLEADLVLALSQGARWEQLAGVIQKRYQVSGRRAALIARDQMGSLNAKLNQQKLKEVGVSRYRWRNSQDERVVGNPSGLYPEGNDKHGDHWEREGQIFSWADPPHDGHPGEPIQCRCHAEPVWDDAEGDEKAELVEPGIGVVAAAEVAAGVTRANPPIRTVGAGAGTPEDFYEGVRPSARIKTQEREYSCGVACVRQVLEDAGISITEKELREEVGYSFFANTLKGLPPENLGRLLRAHGVSASAGAIMPEDANIMLRDGSGPFIALIENHWVVVDSVVGGIVKVRDPWGSSGPGSPQGLEGEVGVDKFREAWLNGKLGVVVW